MILPTRSQLSITNLYQHYEVKEEAPIIHSLNSSLYDCILTHYITVQSIHCIERLKIFYDSICFPNTYVLLDYSNHVLIFHSAYVLLNIYCTYNFTHCTYLKQPDRKPLYLTCHSLFGNSLLPLFSSKVPLYLTRSTQLTFNIYKSRWISSNISNG